MKLPSPIAHYMADVRDSTGRQRALLIAGGVLVAAMGGWSTYTIAGGAVPIPAVLTAASIAAAAGRAASNAYVRRNRKH